MTPSVSFLGHATTLIEIDGVRVLTDPVLRPRVTFLHRVVPPAPEDMSNAIDVVLISHLHHDHCDLPTLSKLPDAVVVVPYGAGGYLRTRGGLSNVVELAEGETVEVRGLLVTAVHADHDGLRPRLDRELRRSDTSSPDRAGRRTLLATLTSTRRWQR